MDSFKCFLNLFSQKQPICDQEMKLHGILDLCKNKTIQELKNITNVIRNNDFYGDINFKELLFQQIDLEEKLGLKLKDVFVTIKSNEQEYETSFLCDAILQSNK
jgi:hypothetical protein